MASLLENVTSGGRSVARTYEVHKGTPLGEVLSVDGQAWKTQMHEADAAGNLTGFYDAEWRKHAWPIDGNGRPLEKQLAGQGWHYEPAASGPVQTL